MDGDIFQVPWVNLGLHNVTTHTHNIMCVKRRQVTDVYYWTSINIMIYNILRIDWYISVMSITSISIVAYKIDRHIHFVKPKKNPLLQTKQLFHYNHEHFVADLKRIEFPPKWIRTHYICALSRCSYFTGFSRRMTFFSTKSWLWLQCLSHVALCHISVAWCTQANQCADCQLVLMRTPSLSLHPLI